MCFKTHWCLHQSLVNITSYFMQTGLKFGNLSALNRQQACRWFWSLQNDQDCADGVGERRGNNECGLADGGNVTCLYGPHNLRSTHKLHPRGQGVRNPRGLELSMPMILGWRCNDDVHLHLHSSQGSRKRLDSNPMQSKRAFASQ
jgi:hypothetical protein